MKSLLNLHIAVLVDLGRFCSIDPTRDLETITRRWEDEGDSFLTITLPKLAKALERGLDAGFWPRQSVAGTFSHHRGLPRLVSGFLTRIFHQDGLLLDEPDTDCIWAIRQFCLLTNKVERDCSPERVDAAFNTFISTDRELSLLNLDPEGPLREQFKRTALRLFRNEFDQLETLVANFELLPKHGPGGVAEKLNHADRWDFDYWTDRLEDSFPSWRYRSNLPNSLHPCLRPLDAELPVRVVSVPKTQSTPRIIAIEPSTVQYAQQGLKREMYRVLNEGPLGKVLGFTDQTRNREMARESSISGSHATLDLSEASDRVPLWVVEDLLSFHPHLRDFVLAVRSVRADVRGEVISLAKYASMGSALTFPLETMVFTTIALMGIEQVRRKRFKPQQLAGVLSVYGDDIVIPQDTVAAVIDYLTSFGSKVNQHKSFWTGKFRESCGAEFYNGVDVSIVRLRAEVPTSRRDAALIGRLTKFRNRCYNAGLWNTVKHCDGILDPIIRLKSSYILEGSADLLGVLAKDTVLSTPWKGITYDPNLQRWKRKFHRLIPEASSYVVDGEAGLLDWFLGKERQKKPLLFKDPYESQERPHAFSIYMRGIEHLPKSSMGRKARGMILN